MDEKGETRVYQAKWDPAPGSAPQPHTTHFELVSVLSADSQGNVTEEVLPVPRDPDRERWLEIETGQTTEERMADIHERFDRFAAEHAQSVEDRLQRMEARLAKLEREREADLNAGRLGL